jgi:hypothetical protein
MVGTDELHQKMDNTSTIRTTGTRSQDSVAKLRCMVQGLLNNTIDTSVSGQFALAISGWP